MRVSVLKKDSRFDTRNDRALGIQTFGENNDYPQQVKMVIGASGTGTSCLNVYKKFIFGKGFSDENLYQKVINKKGQTADYILDQIKNDFAEHGGFALHFNYNANYKISEIQHVPFEHVRFEKMDESGCFEKVALHWDWARQFTFLRRWRKDDIELIDLYNPLEVEKQINACGGIQNYKGQIYYFSSAGENIYPLPIFDAVLTDMNTEEGVSNVSNRNVRNNFLTAGMFINKKQDNSSLGNVDKTSENERERENRFDENDTEKALKQFQGDEKAGKIMYVEIESDEEKPAFVSFKGTNYDKEFTVTNETVENKIGQVFNQPPILRAKNVGSNFGADLMRNAYNFYNSVTENERLAIERVFTEIFKHWWENTNYDFSIIPLSYEVEVSVAEKIGKDGMAEIVSILNSSVLSIEQKKKSLKIFFGLTDLELAELV